MLGGLGVLSSLSVEVEVEAAHLQEASTGNALYPSLKHAHQ
jgi:hypothetical protein